MSKEIAKVEEMKIAALDTSEAMLSPEAIAEELGGDTPTYTRVKMPSGGGIAFEVPGDDPENPDVQKEIKGIIVWHHKSNAYWASGNTDTDTPPDCASLDGISGQGDPGNSCALCPYNEFGSGEGGRGKACKNMERLYILCEDNILPYVLALSPTSLNAWRNYKTMCITKGKRVCDVVTSITLSKRENSAGQPYSVAVFKISGPLSPEMARAAYEYRQGVKAMVSAGHDTIQDVAVPFEADPATGEVVE